MQLENLQKNRHLLRVGVFLVLILACGNGENGFAPEIASPHLNPGPAVSFPSPSPLPDSFDAVACPDLQHVRRTFDLAVKVTSPNAPSHDFDRDGKMDSILLVRGDPQPKTLVFQIHSLRTPIYDHDIDQSLGIADFFHGGYEWTEHLEDPDGNPHDMIQSFGSDILPYSDDATMGAYTNTGHNPIVEQVYVPGETTPNPAFPNHAPLCPAGAEGAPAPCDPIPFPLAGIFYDKPGVHVIAAHILETDATLHCTRYVWRILICPVACHCDAQGNPLHDRNCDLSLHQPV